MTFDWMNGGKTFKIVWSLGSPWIVAWLEHQTFNLRIGGFITV